MVRKWRNQKEIPKWKKITIRYLYYEITGGLKLVLQVPNLTLISAVDADNYVKPINEVIIRTDIYFGHRSRRLGFEKVKISNDQEQVITIKNPLNTLLHELNEI